jgi:riboflavin synthase
MFTGIIETTAVVVTAPRMTGGLLTVRPAQPWTDLRRGESISVSGACLTVTGFDAAAITFDVVPETARTSTLGALGSGARLNLERALRAGDRLGGHYVLGHVDCVGSVGYLRREGDETELGISFSSRFQGWVVPKGSIAVNGVSVTIGKVDRDSFSVYLIPHTLRETNLGTLRTGDGVNLEFDYFGKWVLRAHAGETLGELLDQAGFMEENAWNA